MKSLSILFITILLVLTTSCTRQRVYPTVGTGKDASAILKEGKALVLVHGNVTVTEFRKTYRDNFKSSEEFHDYLRKKIVEKLGSLYAFDNAENRFYTEVQAGVDYLKDYLIANQQAIKDAGYTSILVIDKIVIGNEMTNTHSGVGVGFGGGTGFGGGGTTTSSSESAQSQARFEVYSVDDMSVVSEFVAIGTRQVSFFMFTKALKGSIVNMYKRAHNYMKSNKKKF